MNWKLVAVTFLKGLAWTVLGAAATAVVTALDMQQNYEGTLRDNAQHIATVALSGAIYGFAFWTKHTVDLIRCHEDFQAKLAELGKR